MKNDTSYYLVRRAQLKILMRSYFRNGELFEIMNRKAFNDMATKLADKYFYKTGPTIYDEVVDLYRIYLCLAPIIQKQKNSFKIDWTKGNALSWLRRLFNGKNRNWYYRAVFIQRQHDPEKFHVVFRNLGISDNAFIEKALESYLCFWSSDGRKGSLANCIFDPLFFNVQGNGLRIENMLIETSPSKRDGFVHIAQKPLQIMCYSISAFEVYGRSHVEIRLADDYITAVKQRLNQAISLKAAPEYKLSLMQTLINSVIENARYAKDSFEQMQDIQKYFVKQSKRLAAGNAEFRHTAGSITPVWLERTSNRFTYQRTNFFWDKNHNDIPEKTFLIYFSPYREQL